MPDKMDVAQCSDLSNGWMYWDWARGKPRFPKTDDSFKKDQGGGVLLLNQDWSNNFVLN